MDKKKTINQITHILNGINNMGLSNKQIAILLVEIGYKKVHTIGGNMNGFIIPTKLPSLNEYQNACRVNRYAGAKFKKETETVIELSILKAMKAGNLRPPNPPVRIAFVWHEKTRRRDADNIASAKKYILDAMQHMNVIPNDNRKVVKGFTDEIVDDTSDYVEVNIIEL